jgi:hypothetical protein
MSMVGRSIEEAARKLTDHLNGVLCRTLTETRLQLTSTRNAPCVNIGFRSHGGHAEGACFSSDYGQLSLSLSQNFESLAGADGMHDLRTTGYWYYLFDSGGRSFMRWEYSRFYPTRETWPLNQGKLDKDWVEPKYYPRHHTQVETTLDRNGRILDLDRLHVPTGYVPIEDIVRFCIEDLGARFRHRASDWHQVLQESYHLFCQDFTKI